MRAGAASNQVGKETQMFGRVYDKADWGVAALLIAAMVLAVFA